MDKVFLYGIGDIFNLLIGQLGKHRERNQLPGTFFGNWKTCRFKPEMVVCFLAIEWHWVVNSTMNIL